MRPAQRRNAQTFAKKGNPPPLLELQGDLPDFPVRFFPTKITRKCALKAADSRQNVGSLYKTNFQVASH
jgi:hypothetical protein